MSLFKTLKFVIGHPLNRGRVLSAVARFVNWQIVSRLRRKITFEWIEGAKLIVRRGMTGATGNIYASLHEYEDMSFLLHLLRADDTFVDVGANIGSYTILASKVCGCKSIAVEPDPQTARYLAQNVAANSLEGRVAIKQTAVGAESGIATFSVGRDTTNQVVASDQTGPSQSVDLITIDEMLDGEKPILIKIDVEGYEPEALKGAVKTLASNGLLAIIIETIDTEVVEKLQANGFAQYSYKPKTRHLSRSDAKHSKNALFIREAEVVEERLKKAAIRHYRGVEL